MLKRKKPPAIIPQGHLAVVGKADSEIEAVQKDLDAVQAVCNEMEGNLRALSPHYEARNARRNAAHLQREAAQEQYDQAQCYAALARDAQSESDLMTAESRLNEAAAALRRELEAIEQEEEGDNDQAARFNKTKLSAEVQIGKYERQIERLQAARAKAFGSHGEQEKKLIELAFRQIEDQEAAARAQLQDLAKQKSQLTEEIRARLVDYPEHLRDILLAHVPYEDVVTRLISANIEYRRAILSSGNIYKLIDLSGFPDSWIETGIATVRADWMEADTKDIQRWLERYIEKQL